MINSNAFKTSIVFLGILLVAIIVRSVLLGDIVLDLDLGNKGADVLCSLGLFCK